MQKKARIFKIRKIYMQKKVKTIISRNHAKKAGVYYAKKR